MGGYYDEIEIEDMTWDDVKKVYHYPCPCGDRFEISKGQLKNYEDIATCPSCSLIIRVIYDPLDFEDEEEEEEEEEGSVEEENSSESVSDQEKEVVTAMESLSVAPDVAQVGCTKDDVGGEAPLKENSKAADGVAASDGGIVGGILKSVTGLWA
ncbi:Diphthamide biosynthesis protein 3 [Tulasnella sp. 417]|nr:Diphthamide biosynthesis protein 3 [Tulasnella sp. 417]